MAETTKNPDTKGEQNTNETTEEPKKKAPKKAKTYTVKVKNNYTGIGAGGVAFAKGVATGVNERMAQWFREHKGYTVTAE
jgi:hypothetical protein